MEAKITLQELATKLNGNFWLKEGKERVYLNRGYNTKKMKTTTYVEIINENFVVKSFVDCQSQDFNWCKSQANIVINNVTEDINELLANTYFYVLNENNEVLNDNGKKSELTDMYVGGGLYIFENSAKDFIKELSIKAYVKSISRSEFEKLEKEATIVAQIIETEYSAKTEKIDLEILEKNKVSKNIDSKNSENEERNNKIFLEGYGKIKEFFYSESGKLDSKYFHNKNISRSEREKMPTFTIEIS